MKKNSSIFAALLITTGLLAASCVAGPGAAPEDDPAEYVGEGQEEIVATNQLFAVLSTDASVWQYSGQPSTWKKISSNTTASLAAAGDQLYAVLETDASVWQYSGQPNVWTKIGSNVASLAAAGSQLYAVLSTDASVWKYSGQPSSWTKIGINMASLAAAGSQLYAVNKSDASVWQYSGQSTTWTKIGTNAASLTAAGSQLYAVLTDASVWQYSGQPDSWTKIGTNMASLAAAGSQLYAVNKTDASAWQYSGQPTTWTKIGTNVASLAASDSKLYATLKTDASVWQYSGQPSSWTKIGINTALIAAGQGVPPPPPPVPAQCVAQPLSPVGAAMRAVPGVGDRLSRCAALPGKWLHEIEGVSNFDDYRDAIKVEFAKTRVSFSHSSLWYNPGYHFDDRLFELHNTLTTTSVPEKPIIRFMVGEGHALVTYIALTSKLPKNAQGDMDPSLWNVRVAVSVVNNGLLSGWNHTKMNIRDGFAAFVGSVEVNQYELAIQLGATPAFHAQNWFDKLWLSNSSCVGSDESVCDTIPPVKVAVTEPGYTSSGVNVFSLRRGYVLDTSWKTILEADEALFAGMDATRRSIFFLSPGMTANWPSLWKDEYSKILVDKIVDRLADGVDVKFVWGDKEAQPLTPEKWLEIETQIDEGLGVRGLSQRRRDIGLCMFHVAHYGEEPTPQGVQPRSHAKFYMLDDGGFYIGSQNMYPSGIRSQVFSSPELDEFGYYIDATPSVNAALSAKVTNDVVIPTWTRSRPYPELHRIPCGALPHATFLHGSTDPSVGNYVCAGGFDLSLDFYQVAYNEIARVSGETTCSSAGMTVSVSVNGVIRTDGTFSGTIFGSVPGVAADSAPLVGTFTKGVLNLSFSDLEPIHDVPYSGTVTTLPSP